MEISLKKNIENFPLPLPIFTSINIADAVSKDGENFSIFIGLDKKMVEQLKNYSMDESDVDLQKNTKDKKRFVVGSYEDWYKKNRTPFALVHNNSDTLAALVRFGPEPFFGDVGNWHTAGWRSYKPFRGKGIMKDFTQFALDIYMQKFPDIKIWITAKKENTGSVMLATKLGFKVLEKESAEESLNRGEEIMVMAREAQNHTAGPL